MSNTSPLNAYAVKERAKDKKLSGPASGELPAQERYRLHPRARGASDRRQDRPDAAEGARTTRPKRSKAGGGLSAHRSTQAADMGAAQAALTRRPHANADPYLLIDDSDEDIMQIISVLREGSWRGSEAMS